MSRSISTENIPLDSCQNSLRKGLMARVVSRQNIFHSISVSPLLVVFFVNLYVTYGSLSDLENTISISYLERVE